RASPPAARIASTTASLGPGRRSMQVTRAPSSAKRRAMASPRPIAAPVTMATLPCRRGWGTRDDMQWLRRGARGTAARSGGGGWQGLQAHGTPGRPFPGDDRAAGADRPRPPVTADYFFTYP